MIRPNDIAIALPEHLRFARVDDVESMAGETLQRFAAAPPGISTNQ